MDIHIVSIYELLCTGVCVSALLYNTAGIP